VPDGDARRATGPPRWGTVLPPGCPTVLIDGQPAARATDMCLCIGPPDSIALGSPTVMIANLMAARMSDPTVHGGMIVLGCPTVMIGGPGATVTVAGGVVTVAWGGLTISGSRRT